MSKTAATPMREFLYQDESQAQRRRHRKIRERLLAYAGVVA